MLSSVHKVKENCDGRGCRPVAVIDPESAEDVERLAQAYIDSNEDVAMSPGLIRERVQNALREFAAPTPPRPDEPQGLGAVVEDTDGLRWVRADESGLPWLCRSGGALLNRRWSDLDVRAEPLSEGVTR